jgi:cyclophilin family peptidyl-prolyl cis-trans isomerase
MIRPVLHLALAATLSSAALFGCDTGTQGGTDATSAPVGQDAPKTSAAITIGETPKAEPDPVETAAAEQGAKPAGDTAAPGATMPVKDEEVAVLDTNQGQIILKFFPKSAPNHVENFKKLAKKGFYDGVKFHRVIPGFMIQGGDPNTKTGKGPAGQGGPGYTINAEFNSIKHKRGILSMARTSDPNSAGSQFFIMHADSPNLDGQYSAFGQVVKGMDVVDKIATLPTDGGNMPTGPEAVMKKVTIEKWPVK